MAAQTHAGAPARGRAVALGVVLGVLFLTFLDTTIVSVTLGDLESDISAGIIPLQWVINAYALTFASLMLVGGSLADRYGRKWLMLGGIVVFCVGSVIAALADDAGTVIAGRAIMGVGAAASEPGTLSIIRQLYPQRGERARALGGWSAVSGLALALGPVIGGLLIGADGWRAVFWFNLAAGALLGLLVWRFVPNSADPQTGRPDLAGFVLGTAAIGCAVYAAITGEYHGYATWWIVLLFVLAGLFAIAFAAVERRVAAPMLDLAVIRKPVIGSSLLSAFAVYFAVFALFFLTALYLNLGLGYSGTKIAAMFAPMAVTVVGGGLLAGAWVARVGGRVPCTVGCALGAAGLAIAWAVVRAGADGGGAPTVSFAPLTLALAVAGLGFGITVVPLTSTVLSNVPARLSGMGASATNTARQLGAVVGVAALGAIANAHLVHGVDKIYSTPLGPAIAKAGLPKGSLLTQLETGGSGGFTITKYRTGFFAQVLEPFLTEFAKGLQVALIVALILMVIAGVVAALVPDPEAAADELGEPVTS